MARLSKNERIKQHKRVYGKSFVVESIHNDEPFTINVKVTKLIRKGLNDVMFLVCTGTCLHKESMFEYAPKPFRFWATVAFTRFGPAYRVRGGSNHLSTPHVGREMVRGCENILLEVTILGDNNEQDPKASVDERTQTETEAERRT